MNTQDFYSRIEKEMSCYKKHLETSKTSPDPSLFLKLANTHLKEATRIMTLALWKQIT